MTVGRILIATTIARTLEAFLLPYAGHLRSLGWTVDAMANGVEASSACAEAFDHTHPVSWKRSPLDIGAVRSAMRQVDLVLQQGKYDIVHFHTPVSGFVGRMAARECRAKRGLKVVYTAHGFHFYAGQGVLSHTVYRALEATAAGWTDRLVVINSEDYQQALRFRRIEPSHVVFMPGIGVDTRTYAPADPSDQALAALRADVLADQATSLVVMVAEFLPNKRHELALRALAAADAPGLTLAFVGSGPREAEIRRLAEDLGVDRQVVFLGYRHDVPRILKAADACLLCSRREGLPRSLLEAMATAKPVIAGDIRGVRDLVDSSVGWLVPHDDVSGYAAALGDVASNPAEARERGVRALERIRSGYGMDVLLSAHCRLYEDLLA
jgi:glycosyltransferase involved in cell wall biosynthesis